jgi:hypothetical protein
MAPGGGAFQVVFCSNPDVQNAAAQFTSGMGTITITASPGIAAQIMHLIHEFINISVGIGDTSRKGDLMSVLVSV